jgi:hypothetical protein
VEATPVQHSAPEPKQVPGEQEARHWTAKQQLSLQGTEKRANVCLSTQVKNKSKGQNDKECTI